MEVESPSKSLFNNVYSQLQPSLESKTDTLKTPVALTPINVLDASQQVRCDSVHT